MDNRKIQADFGEAATHYDQTALLQRQVGNKVFRWAKEIFPKNATLLDAGCGTGGFARQVEEQENLRWNLVQVDIAHRMCQVAGEGAVQADIQDLPIKTHTMDGAVSSLAVQWIANVPQLFSEIARVLKRRGQVIITGFGPLTLSELRQSFTRSQVSPRVNAFLSLDEVVTMANEVGLRVLRTDFERRWTQYETPQQLLRHMQMIGARYKGVEENQLSVGQLRRVCQQYEKDFSTPHGVVSTWDVWYASFIKDAA